MRPADLERLAAERAHELDAPMVSAMAAAVAERGLDPLLCGEVYERERARDRAGRRAGGVYYTPGYVVDLVIERSVGEALAGLDDGEALELRIIDPACGGAVFLLAALDRIEAHLVERGRQEGPELRTEIARRCLCGIDIDPVAAAVSRLALSMACGGADVGTSIACADGLLDSVNGAGRFDVVLGNPPWGQKGFRFDAAQKKALRARFRTASGVLDPFKLFVERASELAGHRFNIHLDAASLSRLRSLRELPRFGERFEVHEGVHSGNVRRKLFVDTEPRGPGAELIVGRDEVQRYRLTWAGGWIDLDPERIDREAGEYANLGRPEWHQRSKLVVRRTGDRIVAALDARGYYVSNNVFVVLPREAMTLDQLRAHVALLNSSFMTWYFRTVQPRTGRLFAELKIEHLVDFPLPEPEAWRAHSSALAALAACLEGVDDPEAEREIDRRVGELYGI